MNPTNPINTRNTRNLIIFCFLLYALCFLLYASLLEAKVTGNCVNCHTMHNSQNGQPMATFGGTTSAQGCLLRGTCLGCHGQSASGTQNIIPSGNVPQVLHAATTDLAGGNFAYITGAKTRGTGTDENTAGHNPIDVDADGDGVLTSPPGDENATGVTNATFTCSGAKGCHGDRSEGDKLLAIKGSHHAGISGKCDTADTVANSYRFLKGVKGHENMATSPSDYRWQNVNSQYHNEYYGVNNPNVEGSATSPAQNTISGLCAECHGNFHAVSDIGGSTSSPFTRHPTDIVLKGSGEYASYTTYSVVAPIARPSVYDTINTAGTNDKVTPGTDIIMCLSCHRAHASPYFKMMRWDYKSTTLSTAISGCNVCHTSKN